MDVTPVVTVVGAALACRRRFHVAGCLLFIGEVAPT